jgi:hypothetical protein
MARKHETSGDLGVSELIFLKNASADILSALDLWSDRAEAYLSEVFNNEREQIYQTEFGDNLAIIADITENVRTDPNSFRGLQDLKGLLQVSAIVARGIDCLEIELMATAPWNILKNQPETLKGAGTRLIIELVNESIQLGFAGKLQLYAIPRARQFYQNLGFEQTLELDWILSSIAAYNLLEKYAKDK